MSCRELSYSLVVVELAFVLSDAGVILCASATVPSTLVCTSLITEAVFALLASLCNNAVVMLANGSGILGGLSTFVVLCICLKMLIIAVARGFRGLASPWPPKAAEK